jgi:hypothetical protein
MPKVNINKRKVPVYTTLSPKINDTLNKLVQKTDLSRPDVTRILLTKLLSNISNPDDQSSIDIIKGLYNDFEFITAE